MKSHFTRSHFMRSYLEKMGIDLDQWKAIVSTGIRRDFRGRRETAHARRRGSPIVRSMVFYGIMGSLMAVNLLSRFDVFMYAFLMLSYSMVMMAFAVILEFGHSIIHPADADILLVRPIHPRTLFLAKLSHLLFHILLIGSALSLGPAFIGIALPDAPFTLPLTFFIGVTLANLATASFIVLIYTGLSMIMRAGQFKNVISFVQVVLMFVIFFAYQLIPRLDKEVVARSISETLLWIMPPAWFAGLIQVMTFHSSGIHSHLALLGCGATLICVGFAVHKISRTYSFLIQKHHFESSKISQGGRSRPARGRLRFEHTISLFRSQDARAGYYLTSSLLRRDRLVKMAVYPLFGMPLAVLLLAVLDGELVDPFVAAPFTENTGMGSMIIFFIFVMITLSLRTMVNSHDSEAAWIFHASPLASPGRLFLGVRGAIVVRLILPFFLLLGIVLSIFIPLIHALKYTASLLIMGFLVLSCATLLVRDFPFSKQRLRGERIQRFSAMLLVAPFFIAAVGFQFLFYGNPISWWTAHGLMILSLIGIEPLLQKRLDRVLLSGEYVGSQ